MKISEIRQNSKIMWSHELVKPFDGYSAYKLSASLAGYGEVGVFIVQIKDNIWKPFYIFIDKDFPYKSLKLMLFKKIISIAGKMHGKFGKE